MALYISTGDGVVVNRTVGLYWGRSRKIRCCRSLLGAVWYVMALLLFTGDGVVGYVAEDLYWGRCGREWGDRSLLGTKW